jgi:hypothetical protein
MFAIQNIEPSYGQIKADQVVWENEADNYVSTPIKLVDCKELLPGGLFEGQSNNPKFDLARLIK